MSLTIDLPIESYPLVNPISSPLITQSNHCFSCQSPLWTVFTFPSRVEGYFRFPEVFICLFLHVIFYN